MRAMEAPEEVVTARMIALRGKYASVTVMQNVNFHIQALRFRLRLVDAVQRRRLHNPPRLRQARHKPSDYDVRIEVVGWFVEAIAIATCIATQTNAAKNSAISVPQSDAGGSRAKTPRKERPTLRRRKSESQSSTNRRMSPALAAPPYQKPVRSRFPESRSAASGAAPNPTHSPHRSKCMRRLRPLYPSRVRIWSDW